MKRLRELEPDDRLMARAHELIDALGPTVASEARLHRVRRALDQPIRRSPRVWALRGALAFAIVGGGASALAFSGAFSAPAEPAPRVVPTSRSVAPPVPRPPTRASQAIEDPREPAEESAGAPTPRGALRARRGEPPVSASDVARVHEAAKALRADGDPERALRLLESSENVGGPLAEEALALRIEAANASREPRAKSFAQSYLSRYPDGRYRELARRTLAAH